jgi:hypothetical protein
LTHDGNLSLRQTRHTREPVKTRIESQDPIDSMMFHDGEMDRVSR